MKHPIQSALFLCVILLAVFVGQTSPGQEILQSDASALFSITNQSLRLAVSRLQVNGTMNLFGQPQAICQVGTNESRVLGIGESIQGLVVTDIKPDGHVIFQVGDQFLSVRLSTVELTTVSTPNVDTGMNSALVFLPGNPNPVSEPQHGEDWASNISNFAKLQDDPEFEAAVMERIRSGDIP